MQKQKKKSTPNRSRNARKNPLVLGLVVLAGVAIAAAGYWYFTQVDSGPKPFGGGGSIAYTAAPGQGLPVQVRVYDVVSQTDRLLTEDKYFKFSYAWTPDDSGLFFQRDFSPPSSRILMVDVASGELKLMIGDDTTSSWMPAVSPDGSRIAFCSDRESEGFSIYVVNQDGSGLTRLTQNINSSAPQWSPDGTKIAFQGKIDDKFEIFVMDADGSNVVNLTNHPAKNMSPYWSPDGKQISFLSDRDGTNGKYDIYLMNADGSGLRNLTNTPGTGESGSSWSPDGNYLVFSIYEQGISHLYFLEVATLAVLPVPVEGDYLGSPVWSHGPRR